MEHKFEDRTQNHMAEGLRLTRVIFRIQGSINGASHGPLHFFARLLLQRR